MPVQKPPETVGRKPLMQVIKRPGQNNRFYWRTEHDNKERVFDTAWMKGGCPSWANHLVFYMCRPNVYVHTFRVRLEGENCGGFTVYGSKEEEV